MSTTSASASATSTRRSTFYGHVGFTDLLFDYTGEVPGTEAFTGDGPRRARIAMVANPSATPIGPGRLKLVQVLDGDGPPAAPEGQAWGELGVCEICLHVRGVKAVHDRLVAEAGATSLMEPLDGLGDAARRVARHRLRRRPVGRQARDDRVDRPLDVLAG